MHIVLLVHNHSVYRAAFRLLLTYELGLRVVEAADISTALSSMRQESVDLIIQSTDLPDRDIVRLIAEAKKKHPGLPALLLATPSSHRIVRRARRLGAYIIESDIDKYDFLDTVHTLLATSPALPVH